MIKFILSINIIDVLVFAALVYAILQGWKKGFIAILFDALAVTVSFFVANKYFAQFDIWLKKSLYLNVSWGFAVAYILLYFFSFIMFIIWGKIFTMIFKTTAVNWANVSLGVALNLMKWVVLLALALVFLHTITLGATKLYIENAWFYQFCVWVRSLPTFNNIFPSFIK